MRLEIPGRHGDHKFNCVDSKKETGEMCNEERNKEIRPYKVKKRSYKVKNVYSDTRNQKMNIWFN